MRLLSILFMIATALAGAQTPPAKADRSAEARLKQVFEAMGRLQAISAEIQVVSRDDSKLPYYPVGRIGLRWRSDHSFRIDFVGGWGDGHSFTSDGSTLLVDFCDIASGVTVRDAKPFIFDNDPALNAQGASFSPIYAFLAGEKGFEKLVAKEGEIVALRGAGDEEGIRFKSASLGTMRVFFDPKDRHLMVRRIEFDNLEHKNNLAVQFAEWGYEKPIDPLDVHTIRYQSVNKGFAKDAFSTAPPKGLRLTDMRAKKSPTPRAGNLRVPDSVSP